MTTIIQDRDKALDQELIIECHCGAHVSIYVDMTTCDKCGTMYNLFGQSLAPVEQWGEETGEHYLDILNGGGEL